MVFTFLAAVAEFERSLIRERVKAGMESARARGRKIGRPPCMVDVAEILKMRAQKYSWRAIGKLFCCSPATALKKAKADLVNYP
jgi:DNA invertase Pin-like site-specific DNA recombinase